LRPMRKVLMGTVRAAFRVLSHCEVSGRSNVPDGGPLLVVFNHVAHLDGPLVISQMPFEVEGLALADLYRVPVTGAFLRLYGVIPVHRGEYDRALLVRALEVLSGGGTLALAPEARQSPTHALERGQSGAAYLALRSGAPILPVGITGTERAYSDWRSLRRTRLTLNMGPPFRLQGPLERGAARRAQLEQGRDEIMRSIAVLLPQEYRGVYG